MIQRRSTFLFANLKLFPIFWVLSSRYEVLVFIAILFQPATDLLNISFRFIYTSFHHDFLCFTYFRPRFSHVIGQDLTRAPARTLHHSPSPSLRIIILRFHFFSLSRRNAGCLFRWIFITVPSTLQESSFGSTLP